MSLKLKLWLAVLSLGLLFTAIVGLGFYQNYRLTDYSKQILEDNYRSLEYMARVQGLIAHLDKPDSLKILRDMSRQELQNITEPGEQLAADSLAYYANQAHPDPDGVERWSLRIMTVNMQAMQRKDAQSAEASIQAFRVLSLAATAAFLVLVVFAFNFPGSILTPITELTKRLNSIADGNYKQQAHIIDDFEMGAMGLAFNKMVEELERFRNSRLAEIIFEKTRFETLFNSLSDPLLILDDKGKIVSANKAAERAYFVPNQQFLGKDVEDLAPNNPLLRKHWKMFVDQDWQADAVLDVVISNKVRHLVPEGLTVEGHDARDNATKVMGYVLRLRDVTEIKDLEIAKSDFLALISHELKTPLSAVNLSLKLLDREQDPDQQRQLHQHIQIENARMLKLVNDVLALSKLQTEQQLTPTQTVNLNELVLALPDHFKVQLQERNQTLNLILPDVTVNVNAQQDRVELAVYNLVSNAIKYGPADQQIEVVLEANNLLIRDHGQGFDLAQVLATGSNNTPSTTLGSTGLGLQLVRQICKRYGWHLDQAVIDGVNQVVIGWG